MRSIKLLISRIKYLSVITKSFKMVATDYFKQGPLMSYCIENNAGDSFNKDFVEDFFNIRVRFYYGGKRRHTIFCGSILSKSNKYSTVLGAGFISKEESEKVIDYYNIIGVRGNLTAQSLHTNDPKLNIRFKGDPGLLVREMVTPKKECCQQSGLIGIIPHFVDLNIAKKILSNNPRYLIIDIKEDYKKVCNQILKCDKILSSSLHGLIFSDAMNVPNAWIGFSNNLQGGYFKFNDYYSVMTNPQKKIFFCRNMKDINLAENNTVVSVNTNYNEMYEVIFNKFNTYKL